MVHRYALDEGDGNERLAMAIRQAARTRVRLVVEDGGVPVAAVVPPDDLKRLDRLDARLAERRRVIDAMRRPFRDVPAEEIEQETNRILAEIREEDRAARQ